MTYDLRREPWIPWQRRDGSIQWGPPALLLDNMQDNPVVAVAAPRPDFAGALQEFLIGLLGAALRPEDEREWLATWNNPPAVSVLQAALDKLPAAFDLDGDGPRFFQDLSAQHFTDVETSPAEQLLIDAPGDETTRQNTDLFVKRDRVEQMGRPSAAMALLTLQTYAPSGGKGHRTSLRGGGPLTTLIDPRVDLEGELRADAQPLWLKLWGNVQSTAQWSMPDGAGQDHSELTFPWLAATRVSDPKTGRSTTPDGAHPLQAHFGLPRRIRLEFGGAGRCDLTGLEDEATVRCFRMLNYGTQYQTWMHPLSPYYWAKNKKEWRPVHAHAGDVGWRDWVGLTLRVPDANSRPANVVSAFRRRMEALELTEARLHAFGYDMKKMKARGWREGTLPVFSVTDPDARLLLTDLATGLTTGTDIAAFALLDAVREALFDKPKDKRGDLSAITEALWRGTEAAFFACIREIAVAGVSMETANAGRLQFKAVLDTVALEVFDRWCPFESASAMTLRRLVRARYNLVMTQNGYTKRGDRLFATLGIPAPPKARGPKKPRQRKARETRR